MTYLRVLYTRFHLNSFTLWLITQLHGDASFAHSSGVVFMKSFHIFQETDPLCAALDELCSTLNFWYGSMNNPWQREDRAYRRQLATAIQTKLKELVGEAYEKADRNL